MTEKLFYEDSHRKSFTAVVEECLPFEEHFRIVLDRTAFFPEGGGQYADTGILETEDCPSDVAGQREKVQVIDVQESDGTIWHITDQAVQAGSHVRGILHWQERFMKMQQHTGEHIVSGLVHARFGYNNVGFHLGSEVCTMDFDGEITKEALREIEYEANEAVVKDLPVQISYPAREELDAMEYRSKIEIDGPVRIVTIPEYDVCACCAPHVVRTGEIGQIKLTGIQRYKGGVRVTMLCGFRALADYDRKSVSAKHISSALCVKEEEIGEAVDRLKEECAELKLHLSERQKELLSYKAKDADAQGEIVCIFESGLEGEAPRLLMNLVLDRGHLVCAVFCRSDRESYRYVIGSRTLDMRRLAKELNEAFSGKGGGKPEMVQGSLKGTEEKLRVWIQEKVRRWKDE